MNQGDLKSGLSGRIVNWAVLDENDEEQEKGGTKSNLILDSGLDFVASHYYADLAKYCAVGTDQTTPDPEQKGLINEVARTNQYFPGEGHCGSRQETPTKRVYRRTFDFPIGALDGTYRELGFSPFPTNEANLFSRTLPVDLDGNPTTISVAKNQRLRVVYEWTVNLSPEIVSQFLTTIDGLGDITGEQAIQATYAYGYGEIVTDNMATLALSGIRTDGQTTDRFDVDSDAMTPCGLSSREWSWRNTCQLEPKVSANPNIDGPQPYCWVSDHGEALATPGLSENRCGSARYVNITAPAGYVPGSHRVVREFFMDSQFANFPIKSFGVGVPDTRHYPVENKGFPSFSHAWAAVFDEIINKKDTHTLALNFSLSWGRE